MMDQKKMIIQGVTEHGGAIRPSDWAERMCGSLSTFHKQRICYSPLLKPIVRGGEKCVLVDPALRESHPEIYEDILKFIHQNRLKVCQE